MIRVKLTNDILKKITEIEKIKVHVDLVNIPIVIENRFRKNSKKKSSYYSTKIEGNPLSEKQAGNVIEATDADDHKHFLRPEQEVRNYYLALKYLEEQLRKNEKFSKKLILKIQALVEKGAPSNKIGIRGAMPPGVLFAVYDTETGNPEYIPPEYSDIPALLDELVSYVNDSDDHPLIKAAVVHYQLVTIHPFEDGNGRTARLISGYVMDYFGYDFRGIGSLEEFFAYDLNGYYASLQMGLPVLYYEGRNDPPHPEIWIHYFLRMVHLYVEKILQTAEGSADNQVKGSLSYLSKREKEFLIYILDENVMNFKPVDISKKLGVTNKTVINRCAALVKQGFLKPEIVKTRITAYSVTDFAFDNKDILGNMLRASL